MTKYEHDQERWRDEKEMLRHSILGDDEPECRTCPKCHSGDYNQRHHEYSTEYGPNVPDCSWWVCEDCEYESEPE